MSTVILITGTSSGFGRTIAEKLHFEGYTVIGTSRNAEKISSDYLTIKLDINDYEASKSEVDQIINKYGKIDILINNAGINITGPAETIKMDDVIIAESLNIELKKYNVNVVNIAPGDYKTEILNNRRDSENPSSSPYFQEYKKIIKSVDGKMNHGRDPIEVANLVLKIIKEKKPKINYLVGGFLEKKITLKSLLPDKLFQKIIMKLYS